MANILKKPVAFGVLASHAGLKEGGVIQSAINNVYLLDLPRKGGQSNSLLNDTVMTDGRPHNIFITPDSDLGFIQSESKTYNYHLNTAELVIGLPTDILWTFTDQSNSSNVISYTVSIPAIPLLSGDSGPMKIRVHDTSPDGSKRILMIYTGQLYLDGSQHTKVYAYYEIAFTVSSNGVIDVVDHTRQLLADREEISREGNQDMIIVSEQTYHDGTQTVLNTVYDNVPESIDDNNHGTIVGNLYYVVYTDGTGSSSSTVPPNMPVWPNCKGFGGEAITRFPADTSGVYNICYREGGTRKKTEWSTSGYVDQVSIGIETQYTITNILSGEVINQDTGDVVGTWTRTRTLSNICITSTSQTTDNQIVKTGLENESGLTHTGVQLGKFNIYSKDGVITAEGPQGETVTGIAAENPRVIYDPRNSHIEFRLPTEKKIFV